MTDFIARGTAWLASQLRSQASQSITYQRGDESITILATPARTERTFEDTESFEVTAQRSDFLVRAADLDFGAGRVSPETRDRIVFVAGGRTLTYQVAPLPAESHFRFLDSHRTLLRIHAELIGDDS